MCDTGNCSSSDCQFDSFIASLVGMVDIIKGGLTEKGMMFSDRMNVLHVLFGSRHNGTSQHENCDLRICP